MIAKDEDPAEVATARTHDQRARGLAAKRITGAGRGAERE